MKGKTMNIGTKSLLFGAYQFILHPLFVFLAWWKLYGFPWDPRLWLAFLIHDWGYWEAPNMDGPQGELHPVWAAQKFSKWFDLKGLVRCDLCKTGDSGVCWSYWGRLLLYHSRFLAHRHGVKPSRLCWADKLSVSLMPWWIYIPLAILSGEIHEYMKEASDGKYKHMKLNTHSYRQWYSDVSSKMRQMAYAGKSDLED